MATDECRLELLVGLGVWTVLEAAAIAYSRGAGGILPTSRYMDTLSLALVVNGAALLALATSRQRWVARVGNAVFVVWLVAQALGLDGLTRTELEAGGAETRKAWHEAYERNLRAFVHDDDLTALLSKSAQTEIPFWSTPMLANAWLRHPWIRQILPASIRGPLAVMSDGDNDAFVVNGYYPTTPADPVRPAWGSYGLRANETTGTFTSRPLACPHNLWIDFEVAGYLGSDGLALALQPDAQRVATPIRPSALAHERWLPASVRCPGVPFRIVARDDNRELWFAFREPVEIGAWSAAAGWLARRHRWIILCGLLLAALALRRQPRAGPGPPTTP
jgi:hypothetical protein